MGATLSKLRANTKPIIKAFNCPNCGTNLKVKAVGLSINVVCGSCHSQIDTNSPELEYLKSAQKLRKVKPCIRIGSRGTFSGKVYQCIGFMQKKDGSYYWREYLLYNPYVGFKWLVEVDGHWSIHKRFYINPNHRKSSSFNYKGRNFHLFNNGSSEIDYIEGEFYWRAKRGDSAYVQDYISPPYMISFERTDSETNCSFGKYIEKAKIAEIFKISEASLPMSLGIGAIEPSWSTEKIKEISKPLMTALTAIFVITILRVMFANSDVIFDHHFNHRHQRGPEKGKNEIKSPTFEIKKNNSNLEITLKSDASQSWFYLDALLVNEQTGRGFPFHLNSEYYYGFAGGSGWTSGCKTDRKLQFNVPAGTYFLSMKPQAGTWRSSRDQTNFRVILKSDIVLFRNLLVSLIALFLFPIFILFKNRTREHQRWSNSDYSGPAAGGY